MSDPPHKSNPLRCRPLPAPFGAEIPGLGLAKSDASVADAVLAALAEHGLLLFRRQSLHDDEIYCFSAALGPVEALPARGRRGTTAARASPR